MDGPEHRKSSSCTCSSPWYILLQKQCHLSRGHRGGDNHSSHPKKSPDTASTSSLSRQLGWLQCEEQRWWPERKQVFVWLANTLLAPTRTNRVLPSGGQVLSNEELHLEPMATFARIKIQTQQTPLKYRKQQSLGSSHVIQEAGRFTGETKKILQQYSPREPTGK